MIRSLTLDELGWRINEVDKLIYTLVAHRMSLSNSVGAFKRVSDIPIYNAEREVARITECRNHAIRLGVSPDLMQGLLYSIIGESCKQQMIELQSSGMAAPDVTDQEWNKLLKKNLLELTKEVASSYDKNYNEEFFASSSYRSFEETLLFQEIESIDSRKLTVDLGCATGAKTLALAPYFKRVVGYDISPDMVKVANGKLVDGIEQRASFYQLDLEKKEIPLPDRSASFVVMNMGTASDIPNIVKVISETRRILVPGGRFLFSFYNSNALAYQWKFLPWPVSLAAELNHAKNCLDVHIGKKIFSVYARAYSRKEVEKFFSKKFTVEKLLTFPTVSSILPDQLFKEDHARCVISALDESLADSDFGAYIIVTGKKE